MPTDPAPDADSDGDSTTADAVGWSAAQAKDFIEALSPYPELYDDQWNGIQTIREAGVDQGYAVIEGACGTGKTLMSLAAGLSLVRDESTRYERVLCLTSVKQQLQAFEDDVAAINDGLRERQQAAADDAEQDPPEVVSGLTLVGKQDLCAYEAADIEVPGGNGFYDSCESVRDTVSNTLSGTSGEEKYRVLEQLLSEGAATRVADGDDPARAGDALAAEEWTAPHQRDLPYAPGQDAQFCPFYAASVQASMDEDSYGRGDGGDLYLNGMLTPADIRKRAAGEGLCPHIAMRESMENAEVLVGNYLHAFDPLTRERMTNELITPETFLVIDEAHTLVANVRDLLSDDLAFGTIVEAIGEVLPAEERRDEHDMSADLRTAVDHPMLQAMVDTRAVQRLGTFLQDLRDFADSEAKRVLDDEYTQWHKHPDEVAPADVPEPDPRTVEQPLGAPDEDKTDRLSWWFRREGYADELEELLAIAGNLAEILIDLDEVEEVLGKKSPALETVRRVLRRWDKTGNVQYYRTLALTRRQAARTHDRAWRREFTASLRLHNCIPRDALAKQLDRYGGGVLMSATLAPLEEYRREVGIEHLHREQGCPVEQGVYGLTFPEENRLSLAVDLPKFTYGNRDSYNPTAPPATARFNECRNSYAAAISDAVSGIPGNVLIAAPSYAEGEWVQQALEEADVDRAVLVDESSSNEATEQLKAQFFEGGPKVLVTSLRGTLTEGVDYDGDRLAGVIVLGVPIRPTNGDYPTAIKHAYKGAFGDDGWDLAFGVPAVPKARQAIGRVIRGSEEVGVRLYFDERYTGRAGRSDVTEHLPDYEREEFEAVSAGRLSSRLESFWSNGEPDASSDSAGLSDFM